MRADSATRPTLSVSLPVYNFARYVPDALRSILANEGSEDLDIVVVDGASTDNTAEVVESFSMAHPNVRYVRLPEKGGIDRDMAIAASQTSSDYCWLFSGDDVMLPGAIGRLREKLSSGADLYLCKHNESHPDMTPSMEYPVLKEDRERIFDCADEQQRHAYCALGKSTEAFFSFMGGLIVKKSTWDSVPLDERFVGTCFAHSARLMTLMKQGGLKLHYVPETWLNRRPDNDSFLTKGLVDRMRLGIDGFHDISDAVFGHDSFEAFCVRETVRHDFNVWMMLFGKYLCWLKPEVESRELMDRLVRRAYGDLSWNNLRVRYRYWRTPVSKIRKMLKSDCEKAERKWEQERRLSGSDASPAPASMQPVPH